MFGKRIVGLVTVVAAAGLLMIGALPAALRGAGCGAGGGAACNDDKPAAAKARPFLQLDQKLAAAEKALKGGDQKAALAALAEARARIAEWRASGAVCAKCAKARKDAKAVNFKCPIMLNPINPAKVPDNLVRWYKGQKVGFCCAGCVPKWDALNDAQRDAKLKAVLPKQIRGVVNKRCPIMGREIDPAEVPPNLTRKFQDRTVGFCCAGCLPAWDKLTSSEKAEKLKAAM